MKGQLDCFGDPKEIIPEAVIFTGELFAAMESLQISPSKALPEYSRQKEEDDSNNRHDQNCDRLMELWCFYP